MDVYQSASRRTMLREFSLEYLLIAIGNETGELLGAYKKFKRDGDLEAFSNMKRRETTI